MDSNLHEFAYGPIRTERLNVKLDVRDASCVVPQEILDDIIWEAGAETVTGKTLSVCSRRCVGSAQMALFENIIVNRCRVPAVWLDLFQEYPFLTGYVRVVTLSDVSASWTGSLSLLVQLLSSGHPLAVLHIAWTTFTAQIQDILADVDEPRLPWQRQHQNSGTRLGN
ncbi:uncharacterized protein ARMOST_07494 [Armillaria ostoyae]|uniref:Uncharacterized protein n=1 Tax=Armillaria ostoyae TaxID=47428 RepID=A0A284R5Z1_ARMOS|nr:uncharacterized protein ARMOST_07494 [Armillaria ostoyae]